MTKVVKKIAKRIVKDYFEGLEKLYEPCVKSGIYPFM